MCAWDCSHWNGRYWHSNLWVHGLRLDTSLAQVACWPTPKQYWGLTATTCSDINSQQSKIITALHLPACQQISEVAALNYHSSTADTCKGDRYPFSNSMSTIRNCKGLRTYFFASCCACLWERHNSSTKIKFWTSSPPGQSVAYVLDFLAGLLHAYCFTDQWPVMHLVKFEMTVL